MTFTEREAAARAEALSLYGRRLYAEERIGNILDAKYGPCIGPVPLLSWCACCRARTGTVYASDGRRCGACGDRRGHWPHPAFERLTR